MSWYVPKKKVLERIEKVMATKTLLTKHLILLIYIQSRNATFIPKSLVSPTSQNLTIQTHLETRKITIHGFFNQTNPIVDNSPVAVYLEWTTFFWTFPGGRINMLDNKNAFLSDWIGLLLSSLQKKNAQ